MQCCAILAILLTVTPAFADPIPRQEIMFTQEGSVDGLTPGQPVHVWLPVPMSNPAQTVVVGKYNIPGDTVLRAEPRFGNKIRSIVAPVAADGRISWSCIYQITRNVLWDANEPIRFSAEDCQRPDRLVPIDGKPLNVLGNDLPVGDAESKSLEVLDVLEDYLKYRTDRPGCGRGDAVWAAENRCGDSADFSSLFVSLIRSQHVPAAMQLGYEIPGNLVAGDLPNYHCSAWYYDKPTWYSLDMPNSEADHSMGFRRVDINYIFMSAGRDLVLEPKQQGPPLNFFINPYVEVGGKPLDDRQIHSKVRFNVVVDGSGGRPSTNP